MNDKFILDAIRAKYPGTAIVPEISIDDPYWHDWARGRERSFQETGMKPYRRIDALMFNSFERTAIEIKVSKADFNNDTLEKRRPWQRVVHRFIYAVPYDLNVVAPHGCGLWKVHPNGKITIGKRAIVRKHPEQLPQDVIQRLAYRASMSASRVDTLPA